MVAFHASLNPNKLSIKDTLTLAFDGDLPKPGQLVTVRLLEIDDPSTKTTDGDGVDDVIVEIEGTFDAKKFKVSKVTPKGGASTTQKLKLAITNADPAGVKIPDLPIVDPNERENGFLEIDFDLLVDNKAVTRTRNPVSMKYSRFRNDDRPVIAILAGVDVGTSNPFFTEAERYWKDHADVLIKAASATDALTSVEGIMEWMADNESKYGPFGEVNVVGHGNDFTWDVRTLKADGASVVTTGAFIKQRGLTLGKLPSKLDATSVFLLRGCEIGTNAFLLGQIHKLIGGKVKVMAPKFVLSYGPNPGPTGGATGTSTGPNIEYFREFFIIYFKEKRTSAPADADLIKRFKADFPAAKVDWDARLKETQNRSDWDRQFSWEVDWEDVDYQDVIKDKATAADKQGALLKEFSSAPDHAGFDEPDTKSKWDDWLWEYDSETLVKSPTTKKTDMHRVKFVGHRWRTTVFSVLRETPTGGTPVVVKPDLTNGTHFGSHP